MRTTQQCSGQVDPQTTSKRIHTAEGLWAKQIKKEKKKKGHPVTKHQITTANGAGAIRITYINSKMLKQTYAHVSAQSCKSG